MIKLLFGFVILISMVVGLVGYQYDRSTLTIPNLEIATNTERGRWIDLSAFLPSDLPFEVIVSDLPEKGILSTYGTGLWYQPEDGFTGSDGFDYRVRLGNRMSTPAHVSIEVKAIDEPPIGSPQVLSLKENGQIEVLLSAKTPARGNDRLRFTVIAGPEHGRLQGHDRLTYVPKRDFFGEDRFWYVVSDDITTGPPVLVQVIVHPNRQLTASNVFEQTSVNTALDLVLTDSDSESDQIESVILAEPAHGHLDGGFPRLRYRPKKDFVGTDQFRYALTDGRTVSASATVVIEVVQDPKLAALLAEIEANVRFGGVAVGLAENPELLFNPGQYVPASSLKIATALSALYHLGEHYRFETEFYFDRQRQFYIKGFGDPSLSTEMWKRILDDLELAGHLETPLDRLVLDDTAFKEGVDYDGRKETLHYFDAPLGALSSNQNTATVKIGPGHVIVGSRNNTPVTPMIVQRTKNLPQGWQHLSVATSAAGSTAYTGELILALLQQRGINVDRGFDLGVVSPELEVMYIHGSQQPLLAVVQEMLRTSSNFTANQLLLVSAIDRFGAPVELEQGVWLLRHFLQDRIGLAADSFTIVEGSGLSRKNRIDLLSMLSIVNHFHPYKQLLPSLAKSRFTDLAEIGRKWRILAKSGTLNDISTVAGFLYTREQQWLPFVIMLEKGQNNRSQVLEILCRHYQ
jgi:serine-type D-Ala-D-Ala carboxypeptidase/endopeptidase (penicillin-binding protein 4)